MIQVNVTLGTEGINQLKQYVQSLQGKLDMVLDKAEERVAEYGRTQLEHFAPTMSVDGNMPGNVFVDDDGTMHRVIYAGKDVAFIEFGTGYVGENNPYPDEVALNKAIQESGYTGKTAGWYDVNEHGIAGWVYQRKDTGQYRHSRGMKPEAPVLKAKNETRKALKTILREVLDEEFA
jgi:hypothetical protein